MFTGLVEALGVVRGLERSPDVARLYLECSFENLVLGESICVDGTCLTVCNLESFGFCADVSRETLERTTLGELTVGAAVNLERALLATARLGGHIVTGHVDAVAKVVAVEWIKNTLLARVEVSQKLARLVAQKGSVALNGVSLTVNAVKDATFDVLLIPHTLAMTNLKQLSVGTTLNFEADIVARYVARWLQQDRET